MAAQPPNPVEQIVFERIKEQYEFENDDSTNIDTAATNLVGWNGLIISVLLTGGGILISKGTQVVFNWVEGYLLFLTLAFILSSLIASIIAFKKGGYEFVPNPSYLLELSANSTPSRLLREITGSMIEATRRNRKRNANRKSIIWASQIFFVIAMSLAVTFLILQINTLIEWH